MVGLPAFQHSTFNIIVLMKRIFYLTSSSTKAFFFLFFLVCSVGLNAQTATLSVQGVLTKSDGTAVDDGNEYELTFRLWNMESGGTKVHEETIDNISIVGGVYSVVLGVTTPMAAPFNETYWLGVSVGTSSVELLPRPRLTHAPYALGIVGNSNVFPSTGTVKADALDVNGAVDANGFRALGGTPTSTNGYSFSTGDTDGGIFSLQDNNVSIYANAVKALEATNSGVTIPGWLSVSGSATTGPHTVNGWQEVNGFQKINSNQEVTGHSTIGANQTVDGVVKSGDGIVNKALTNTGMYWSAGNHDILLNVNGENRFLVGANGYNYHTGGEVFTLGAGDLFIHGIKPKGTTGNPRNIAIDLSSGRIFEESSSRRYKKNIRPLEENFSLLLKVQPRIYNRFEDPADIDTSKYFELGYIAEEIDSIGLHRLVQYNNEGQIDGVNYDKMILYAVEVLKMQDTAIKQLQAEVNALKAEKSGLKAENNTLQTANASLQKQQEKFNGQLEGLLKRMQALEASSTGK